MFRIQAAKMRGPAQTEPQPNGDMADTLEAHPPLPAIAPAAHPDRRLSPETMDHQWLARHLPKANHHRPDD